MVDDNILFHMLRKFILTAVNDMIRGGLLSLVIDKTAESPQNVSLLFCLNAHGIEMKGKHLEELYMPYEALRLRIDADSSSVDNGIVIFRSYAHVLGTDELKIETDEETTAFLSLPLTIPLVSSSLEEHRKYDFSGKRILVADDDEINLEIVEKLLRDKGAEVITVRDGREMLLSYRSEHGKFDLLLMDIVMPDMTGLQVARVIRSTTVIPTAKDVPLIAMTVNAFEEHYEESIEAGMNAHLVKPIDPEKLYQTIAGYL